MTEWLEQRTWFRLFFLAISPDIRRVRSLKKPRVWFFDEKVWIKCAAPVVPSFSLQWKSDESTEHYLTQMLLAINWRNWQAGKKFMYAYDGSRSPHACALHWNPPGFRKKNRYGNCFSSRLVSTRDFITYYQDHLTNSMAYGTRRFDAAFTRALQ